MEQRKNKKAIAKIFENGSSCARLISRKANKGAERVTVRFSQSPKGTENGTHCANIFLIFSVFETRPTKGGGLVFLLHELTA